MIRPPKKFFKIVCRDRIKFHMFSLSFLEFVPYFSTKQFQEIFSFQDYYLLIELYRYSTCTRIENRSYIFSYFPPIQAHTKWSVGFLDR